MNSVRIVADSGCDISPTVAAQYDITIIPLLIRFGQQVVSDAGIEPEEFWARAEQSGQIPGTTTPPPGVYQSVFQNLVSAGHDVVCLTLPRQFSGIFNTAWLAAQEFGQRVRVIDSGSITMGMGWQVLAAAREAMAGRSAEAIARNVENLRSRTSVIFVLDTLEWVRRGGRIDRLLPLIERVARTFHVKPVMEIINGELRLLGVTRSYRGAVQRIEEEVRSRLPVQALGAAYTRGRESSHELIDRLRQMTGLPGELITQEAGPVFSCHAGPNACGAIVVRA